MVGKSGGLRIFVFLKAPVSAKLIREALKHWATKLNLSEFEMFHQR